MLLLKSDLSDPKKMLGSFFTPIDFTALWRWWADPKLLPLVGPSLSTKMKTLGCHTWFPKELKIPFVLGFLVSGHSERGTKIGRYLSVWVRGASRVSKMSGMLESFFYSVQFCALYSFFLFMEWAGRTTAGVVGENILTSPEGTCIPYSSKYLAIAPIS